MSGKVIQLDLFREEEQQRQVIAHEDFKKSTTKCIKGLFARYNDLEFLVLEMHRKLEKIQEDVYRNV